MGNKVVGLTLAILSGFFIGISFVFKKKGLLQATAKSGAQAGEGEFLTIFYNEEGGATDRPQDMPTCATGCGGWG